MLKRYALILGMGVSLTLAACAQSGPAIPDQGQQTKTQSTETKPDGTRSGPKGERRQGRGGREGRTPPEAAYAACASLALQSACSLETPRGTLSGTCGIREGDDRALCKVQRPEGRRRRQN